MVTTNAHNVLGMATKTVYLNDPINQAPEEDENKTEPLEPSENGEPTSANSNQEVDYKKRYDDLNIHVRNIKTSFENQISDLKSQLLNTTNKLVSETTTLPKMPKTPEEFKAFEAKYPELAGMITTAAMMVSANTTSAVDQKLKLLEEHQNALRAEKGVTELKKYHPDFEIIKDDPRFIEWFNMQTPGVKALIQSTIPKDIALGLDKFKEYAGIKTQVQKVEARKDATREVRTPNSRVQIGEGQKRTYTNAEINKMSITEFEKNKDDIIAAQYEGRITG